MSWTDPTGAELGRPFLGSFWKMILPLEADLAAAISHWQALCVAQLGRWFFVRLVAFFWEEQQLRLQPRRANMQQRAVASSRKGRAPALPTKL